MLLDLSTLDLIFLDGYRGRETSHPESKQSVTSTGLSASTSFGAHKVIDDARIPILSITSEDQVLVPWIGCWMVDAGVNPQEPDPLLVRSQLVRVFTSHISDACYARAREPLNQPHQLIFN